MKASLRKLRGFTLDHSKHDRKDIKIQPLAQLDELTKASQDMQDMRDCYDSLLSAAAAVASSAYEFSESFCEMGACLLQKIALNDDEESGKVLSMLGKTQFELQRLLDNYRSHIFHTITIPSESLLNELHTVEEMKLQCDQKRELYDYMRTKHKEKGRSRGGKSNTISTQQLQVARDEFDEEATLFAFRLKSLKQGQSRCLLTQAARHHAAQLSFFRKALKSLEAVEPHVKLVTEQQHIDYHFTGLEDDEWEDGREEDDENDTGNGSGWSSEDNEGELSFDYRHNERLHNFMSTSRKSMDLDWDITFPQVARMDGVKENVDTSYNHIRDDKIHSVSAPLLPPRKFDPLERIRQLCPSSTKKFHSYVLPTPGNAKSPNNTSRTEIFVSMIKMNPVHSSKNLYHSVPLETKKHELLTPSKNRSLPPLGEKISSSPMIPCALSESKKVKRLCSSGPLTSRPMSTRPSPYSTEPPQFSSGPILRTPIPQSASSSPRISPSASPTFFTSPRINELHELPRPPMHLSSHHHPASPHGLVGYLAPLVSRRPDNSTSSLLLAGKVGASPLPTPPLLGSFPMTSSSPRSRTVSPSSGVFEAVDESEKAEDNYAGSPPLTPMLLSNC